ncbi:methylmalonyl-CoA decarboxylase [Pseudorhodoplanes sp.]|uniref:methylmalonyl-CoA decarboxylase n=1 Tax=Pseudorhodoplanes sp. TaxID=1934341 RepID=UPI003D1237CA
MDADAPRGPLVETKIDGSIGTIVLDNQERRNALSKMLIDEIVKALAQFEGQQVRVVILRAHSGVKVWSAGHDVSELPEGGRDPLGWDDPLRYLVRAIEEFPAPVIALLEGGVWGGACEVVFACDLIIASPAATFAVTPARLGVPYNVSGMLTFMNACTLRILKEMVFTAKPLSAERAERLGIINHMVPAEKIEAFVLEIAQDIVENAPLSISVMKEQLRMLAGAHPMSPRRFERVQGLRRIVYDSDDYEEGIQAFKQKRKPRFSGH